MAFCIVRIPGGRMFSLLDAEIFRQLFERIGREINEAWKLEINRVTFGERDFFGSVRALI